MVGRQSGRGLRRGARADAGSWRKETDQLAARELLQEGHEYVSILYVLEKVVHLDGRLTLRKTRKEIRATGHLQPVSINPFLTAVCEAFF